METKIYRRGSIGWGLSILISSLALIAFLMTFDLSQDSEFQFSVYGFLCLGFSVILFFIMLHALVLLYDGIVSRRVEKSGHNDSGVITKLYVEKSKIKGRKSYNYYLTFQYTDELGFTSEQTEKVNLVTYERLHHTQMIPILVRKERAVFDKKTFIAQNKDLFVRL